MRYLTYVLSTCLLRGAALPKNELEMSFYNRVSPNYSTLCATADYHCFDICVETSFFFWIVLFSNYSKYGTPSTVFSF